ncbi:DNA primase [Nitrosospira sp. Nsp2]|uniref:DNA primase n=1 Tax=Nitrosospira sp. Nsp2 TaxID=136548 RepID=UPI000D307271|nr:DNA primase [Nitrosospira sp. Nsp2]PTR17113.1 DNA primase [Nitrosospira sp. Nsp2]
MISQSFIQELLDRVDIVDVIERHIPLKKAGANYTACCPFHSEKTPSFTVSQTKQFYHCFGCSAHGNAIGFLIEYNGLNFLEAVADLAARVGLQVPAEQSGSHSRSADSEPGPGDAGEKAHSHESHQSESVSKKLSEVMDVAARFYRQQLRHSAGAISYLKKRGITGPTAGHFAIGYAPPGWRNLEGEFVDQAEKAQQALLVKAGLMIENDGKCYDRFRDRIMFPIVNLKGAIVGFGGRVLEHGEPKYLNSPETPLFQKGRELYNLFGARRAIRQAGRVLVVEGYMDVVALYQHGIEYAVAALGTATTPYHIQKLLRQTDNVVFCFDGDAAGKKAAWRALEATLAQLADGKNISFLFLPEGEDPDSYVRNFGKEAFEELLEQTLPLSVFLFRELSARVDLKTSEGRAKLVQDTKPLLAQVAAPGLALMLLKKLAEISGLSQNELEDLLKIRHVSASPFRGRTPRPQPPSPYQWLMQVLLYDPNYIEKLNRELLAHDHDYADEVAALRALVEFIDSNPHVRESTAMPSVIAYFRGSSHRVLLEKAGSKTLGWDSGIDLEAEFTGAMERLSEMYRKQRMAMLHGKSLSALTPEEKQELQRTTY